MPTLSKKTKILATTAALLAVGGTAVAYWTSTGSGSGNASTGTVVALTVHQTSTITGLAPGGPERALSGNFDNPNTSPIHVASVTASISAVTDADGDPIVGCSTSDYEILDEVATVGSQIPSGDGVGSWSGPRIRMVNTTTNQDACKSAHVVIAYAAS